MSDKLSSMSWRWWAIFAGWLGGCGSDPPPAAGPTLCTPIGKSAACACPNGRTGAQLCGDDGTFEVCRCTGAEGDAGAAAEGVAGSDDGQVPASGGSPAAEPEPSAGGGADGGTHDSGQPDDSCVPGDVAGCACAGESGRRFCVSGVFAACTCAAPSGEGGAAAEAGAGGAGTGPSCDEAVACDATEADCRRAQQACPSDRVAHVVPFSDGVYLEGALLAGASDRAVAQFWPTTRLSYYVGFGSYGSGFKFRPTDGALFYHDLTRGILLNGHSPTTADDVVQLTPPCGDEVAETFGFDGAGTLHYRCADTLRRANGETVARDVLDLAGVLGDGRSVVTRGFEGGQEAVAYAVLSTDGVELARLYPMELFTGSLTLLPYATTVRDDTAYLAFVRSYQLGDELVVYSIDADSRFRLVRRAMVSELGESQLVVSDGTIFIRGYDPWSSPNQRIRAYLPSGSSRIVWREAEAVYVGSHATFGLLTGKAR